MNKIRVVFDCSEQHQGESPNSHLLQGPDLTNNLTGILCRFREELITLMCGIEEMFYQVKVLVHQRPSVLPLVGERRYVKGTPSL